MFSFMSALIRFSLFHVSSAADFHIVCQLLEICLQFHVSSREINLCFGQKVFKVSSQFSIF